MKLPIDVVFRDNYVYADGEFQALTLVVDSITSYTSLVSPKGYVVYFDLDTVNYLTDLKAKETIEIPMPTPMPTKRKEKSINPLTGSYESITAINIRLLLAARGLSGEPLK